MADEKTIRVVPFANGNPYFNVRVSDELMGIVRRESNGYVPMGCRKPLASLEDAAREVVWRKVRRLLKEAATLSALFAEPAARVAIDPSAASTGKPSTRVKKGNWSS